MRIGDRLLAVDGRELRRRPLARVIRPQPTHCFNVLRLAPSRMDALPLSAAAKEHLRAARGAQGRGLLARRPKPIRVHSLRRRVSIPQPHGPLTSSAE